MPELPEVEVTRQTLVPTLTGARIQLVRLGKPLRWPLGVDASQLQGQTIHAIERRAKYLLLRLDQGQLLIHLGMSGSLAFAQPGSPAGLHDHFELQTSRATVRLNDPRRFGAVVYEAKSGSSALLGRLGLEPFDPAFDGAHLRRVWQGKRLAVKQALLAGDAVVGAGNIYACEALFRAGINPRTQAGRLGLRRCERLAQAVRDVLAQAIASGGSTLRDFSNAHGEAGMFQTVAKVYGRAGQACLRCGAEVRHIRQGQRSTFYCAVCQT